MENLPLVNKEICAGLLGVAILGSLGLRALLASRDHTTPVDRPTFEVINPDKDLYKNIPADLERARQTISEGARKARNGILPK